MYCGYLFLTTFKFGLKCQNLYILQDRVKCFMYMNVGSARAASHMGLLIQGKFWIQWCLHSQVQSISRTFWYLESIWMKVHVWLIGHFNFWIFLFAAQMELEARHQINFERFGGNAIKLVSPVASMIKCCSPCRSTLLNVKRSIRARKINAGISEKRTEPEVSLDSNRFQEGEIAGNGLCC